MFARASQAGSASAYAPIYAAVPLVPRASRMAQRSQAAQFEQAPLVAELLSEDVLFPEMEPRAFVMHGMVVKEVRRQQVGNDGRISARRHVSQRANKARRMDRATG